MHKVTKEDSALKSLDKRLEALRKDFDASLLSMERDKGEEREILVRMDEKLKQIQEDIKIIKNGYVKKEEFKPVKMIVYGMVGIILTSVVSAALIIILPS